MLTRIDRNIEDAIVAFDCLISFVVKSDIVDSDYLEMRIRDARENADFDEKPIFDAALILVARGRR